MATTLEERVALLEEKVARLASEDEPPQSPTPWWKKIVGVYKDDPEFDEAERLGREFRKSQRPKDDDPS